MIDVWLIFSSSDKTVNGLRSDDSGGNEEDDDDDDVDIADDDDDDDDDEDSCDSYESGVALEC